VSVFLPHQSPPVQRDGRTYGGPPRGAAIVGLCDGSAVSLLRAVCDGVSTLRTGTILQVECSAARNANGPSILPGPLV
jgi:hypothetical protein